MAQMMNDSPGLVSLGIWFDRETHNLQPDQFFQSLGRNFPALRNLEILGHYKVDWDQFYNQKGPLYRFFEQHTGLRSVAFGGSELDQSAFLSNPCFFFDHLFPSLRDFSGMLGFCSQVVRSPKLSQQIETLKLVDDVHRSDIHDVSHLGIVSSVVSHLPKLRHFEYATNISNVVYKRVDVKYLDKILAVCPSLVSLKIPYLNQLVSIMPNASGRIIKDNSFLE